MQVFTLSNTVVPMNILRHPITHHLNPSFPKTLKRMLTSQPAAKITSLDHLVLTVSSIPTTQKWYEQNLGMKHEFFISAATPSITRHSLIFGSQKINLHQLGKVPPLISFSPPSHLYSKGYSDFQSLVRARYRWELIDEISRSSSPKLKMFELGLRICVS
jgi:hypothetical protein